MFVEIAGRDESGLLAARSRHLLAEGADGPLIPSIAVEAIVHRVLAGRTPTSGARAATRDLELEDYEELFVNRTIFTGVRGCRELRWQTPEIVDIAPIGDN